MTIPTPYEPPDGHIICLLGDVPDGWEYRFGPEDVWDQRGTRRYDAPVFVEARPVRQRDPRWLITDDFPDGHYVKLPITWTNDKGQLVGVTTVGEMRDRTDLDQWEYANANDACWKQFSAYGIPPRFRDTEYDHFPVIVRRRVL